MKTILLLSAMMMSGLAQATGVISGGGGKSVVCRNSAGAITSAEVLDLYEGRIVYGLKYQESSTPAIKQAHQILAHSNAEVQELGGAIGQALDNIKAHTVFVPVGTTLNPVDDSLEVIAPRNCAIEQAVNYQNDNLILFDQEIWNALSQTQKAALLLHESIYKVMRAYGGEKDSRRSRHFNAYIFSGGIADFHDIVSGGTVGACYSVTGPEMYFYLTTPDTSTELQFFNIVFDVINGRKLFSESYALAGNNSPYSPSLIQQFAHPSSSHPEDVQFQALRSNIEGGDNLIMHFGANGDDVISYEGISGLDDSTFSGTLKCFLNQPAGKF